MQRKPPAHRTSAEAKRGAIAMVFAIALGWSSSPVAEGIRCTQEGLWGARCSDGRGNGVGGSLDDPGSSFLSFGQGATRCAVDASGTASCNAAGKAIGTIPNLVGTTRGEDAKAKAIRCTSNGLGVQHCTDGSILGKKCVSDGMGGSRCSWEWPSLGTN